MKRSRLLLFLAVFAVLLGGAYSFAKIGSRNEAMIPNNLSEQKHYLSTEEIQRIDQKVNKLIVYGVGPKTEGRNPTEKEILAAGEGHCGMYAYLLCKELSRYGVEGIVYDLRTYENPSMSHSVVEVQSKEGKMVFDPSYGVFYRSDLEHLLASETASAYREGIPSDTSSYYLADRFWAEVANTVCYMNVCDIYDLKLLRWTTAACSANLPQIAMREALSMVQDKTLEKDSVLTVFAKDEEFYRIKARFLERLDEPLSVECRIVKQNGEYVEMSRRIIQKAYSIELQLDTSVKGSSVQICFLNGSKPLPPLAYYDIYQ